MCTYIIQISHVKPFDVASPRTRLDQCCHTHPRSVYFCARPPPSPPLSHTHTPKTLPFPRTDWRAANQWVTVFRVRKHGNGKMALRSSGPLHMG